MIVSSVTPVLSPAASAPSDAVGAAPGGVLVGAGPRRHQRRGAQCSRHPGRVPSSAHRSPSIARPLVEPGAVKVSGSLNRVNRGRYGCSAALSNTGSGRPTRVVSDRTTPADEDTDATRTASDRPGRGRPSGSLQGHRQLRPQRRPGQPISADTRARVLAAAAELGYTPHAAARQLRTGVSDLVLLAHPPWPNSHALSLCISAFTQRLGGLGYTALVDPATQEVARLAHTLARLQPVALVASGDLLTEPLVARLRSAGTRAVLGFADRPLGLVPTVVFDQSAVTRVAMAHLARRGHRSVVAVMPADPAFEWFRAGRQAGAQEAADEHGMALTVVESPLDHDRIGSGRRGRTGRPDAPRRGAGLQRRLRPPRAPGPRRRGHPRARRRRGDRVRQPARGRAVHPAPHHGRRRHERVWAR